MQSNGNEINAAVVEQVILREKICQIVQGSARLNQGRRASFASTVWSLRAMQPVLSYCSITSSPVRKRTLAGQLGCMMIESQTNSSVSITIWDSPGCDPAIFTLLSQAFSMTKVSRVCPPAFWSISVQVLRAAGFPSSTAWCQDQISVLPSTPASA